MSGDITIKKESEIAVYTSEQLQLIKNMYAVGTTDDEFKVFVELAKRYALDPFKRQIWCVKYGNNPASIFTGRDGFLHIAHQNPMFRGLKTYAITTDGQEVLICPDVGKLAGAVCYVFRSDWSEPMVQAVSLKEYNTGKSLWAKMPEIMIKKVAESMALRKAFDVSGLYAPEEFELEEQSEEKEKRTKKEPEKLEEPKSVFNAATAPIRDLNVQKEFDTSLQQLAKCMGRSVSQVSEILQRKFGKPITSMNDDQVIRVVEEMKLIAARLMFKESVKAFQNHLGWSSKEVESFCGKEPETVEEFQKLQEKMKKELEKGSDIIDSLLGDAQSALATN